MKFIPEDFNDVSDIARLLNNIDTLDAEYANTISDEIFDQQPFFLTVLLGHQLDTSLEELEEIMKIYFLIWEFFKKYKNVRTKKVTKAYFMKIQKRNIQMLKYTSGEPGQDERMKIFSNDLKNLKSKALWAAVLLRCQTIPVLVNMDVETKGSILIGIKSFIECFETI